MLGSCGGDIQRQRTLPARDSSRAAPCGVQGGMAQARARESSSGGGGGGGGSGRTFVGIATATAFLIGFVSSQLLQSSHMSPRFFFNSFRGKNGEAGLDCSREGRAAGGGGGDAMGYPNPGMEGVPCHRRTESGLCVTELFQWFDEAYKDLWPAKVDLLVRSYISDKFFLLEMLFKSIDQMWPKNVGDVVLVMDKGNEMVIDFVPTWIKVMFEDNYLNLPGKMVQQWSYLWADNYTTAPFIAVIDDDVIFELKVTPSLLFNLTTGKPYVIGSAQKQSNHWVPSTHFFVGRGHYRANFMVQLPFVFPRSVLPAFRQHVAKVYPDLGSFDAAMKHFDEKGPRFERTQISHTTLGNYMHDFTNSLVHWAMEWSMDQIPIPRVGVHLPWCEAFRVASNHSDSAPKVTAIYAELASVFTHEAVCHAVPRGQLAGCNDALAYEQQQIWRYALDWHDWPMMFDRRGKKRRRMHQHATMVYDRYKYELECMYRMVSDAGVHSREWRRNAEENGAALVSTMRNKCLWTTSSVDNF